ncbi:MAG: hypothetical protein WC969_02850 [Elusimicrobiota bacterium]|jgi:hypothetical protein
MTGSLRRLLLLAAALPVLACANPPNFVKKTPVLRTLYRPPFKPYLDSPVFSFEIRRSWTGPEPVAGGTRYRSKDGASTIEVAFHAENAKGWRPVAELRRDMAAWGSVEDTHTVVPVRVSTASAYRVAFTSYEYDPEYLLGASSRVTFTDFVLVPDPEGIIVARLRVPKGDYERHLRTFNELLRSMVIRTVTSAAAEE